MVLPGQVWHKNYGIQENFHPLPQLIMTKNVLNKTRIIEIVGPPGIGKSTIYNALSSLWKQQDSWQPQNALLRRSNPPISQVRSWLGYHLTEILSLKKSTAVPVEVGLRFANNHKALSFFFWSYLCGHATRKKDAGNAFSTAYFLFKDFCRYQAIWDANSPRPCLLDNGFLSKAFLFHEDEEQLKQQLDEYLSLVPLPHAIICLENEENEPAFDTQDDPPGNDQKLQHPAELMNLERCRAVYKMIVEKMEGYRIPLCRVNVRNGNEKNLPVLLNFLHRMGYTESRLIRARNVDV